MNIYNDMCNLYPMCRSITGESTKKTLEYIKNKIPINIHCIETGKEVFDWKIPREWNIRDAYIKNSKGEKIVDLSNHYLHILNYSIPMNKKMNLEELKKHIYTLPEFPDWIPYFTSYYKDNWGFCMKHNDFLKLEDDTYEVFIDSSLENGNLHYADLIIKGKSEKEILISSYCCHPQQCNDSLSGTVVAMHLAKYLLNTENYYSYRFVFIPETIGAITYISQNLEIMKKNIIGGYTLTCLGDEGDFTYLKTRKENQFVDKITLFLLKESGLKYKVRDFHTCGSDERQYNYPGIDLNIGSLMKTKYAEFDEYHTSADNLDFVTVKGLKDSYDFYIKCINLIEVNHFYKNNILCEPFLSKHGLYTDIGALKTIENIGEYCRRILYYCDGNNDLIDIYEILKKYMNFKELVNIINILINKKIIYTYNKWS
jgi:aminopeptidase-like protein